MKTSRGRDEHEAALPAAGKAAFWMQRLPGRVWLAQLPGWLAVVAVVALQAQDERTRTTELLASHSQWLALALEERHPGEPQRTPRPARAAPDRPTSDHVAPAPAAQAREEADHRASVLAGAALPPGWFSLLVDDEGATVARQPAAAGGVPAAETLRQAIAGRPDGVAELPGADGVPVLIAFARSPRRGTTVVVGLSGGELSAALWRSAGAAGVVGGSVLILLLALAVRRRQPLQSAGAPGPRTQAGAQAVDARLGSILQTARDAILVCDAGQRVVLANRTAHALFRAPEPSLAGAGLQQLLEPDTWAQLVEECDCAGSGARPREGPPSRGQGRRSDGRPFSIEYAFARFVGSDGAPFCTLVIRDITGRLQRRRSLLRGRGERQRVHGALQKTLAREQASRQQAIARELHDAIGSSLAGVNLLLGTARSFTRDLEAAVLIARSQEQVTRIGQQVREIARGIMPAGEESGALACAVERFVREIGSLPALTCSFSWRGDFDDVSPEVGGHLFRIIQEATTNALRHGGATHVRLTLARAGERCRLTVLDDGCGFDPAALDAAASGMGLQSMRDRARAIGASFRIGRRPGRGVRLRVAWTAPDGQPSRCAVLALQA